MNLHWHVIITQSRQFILRLHLGVVRSKNFVKCILQQIVGSHKVFVLPIYLSSTSVIIKKNLIVSKKKQKRSGIWHKYSGFPIPCCCCSVTQSYPTLCNLMDCSTRWTHYLQAFIRAQLFVKASNQNVKAWN